MKTAILIVCLLFAASAYADEIHKLEKEYAATWCAKHAGRPEVVLQDGARADCVTKRYAVEVEFAHKWAESIGQALFYSMELKRQPAIVLIADRDQDYRFIGRLHRVARKYKIKVFRVDP